MLYPLPFTFSLCLVNNTKVPLAPRLILFLATGYYVIILVLVFVSVKFIFIAIQWWGV